MLSRDRSLALSLAATYLATITVGAAFHRHGRGDGCSSEVCRDERSVALGPLSYSVALDVRCLGASAVASVMQHRAEDSGPCPVCRFFSHKPLALGETPHVECGPPVERPSPPASARVALPIQRTWHSRAPPILR
jgi:hypothetical protein